MEVCGVVGHEGDGVGEGGGGDPEVVGTDELVLVPQVSGGFGVMIHGLLIHRQDFKASEHGGAGRVVEVAESFGEFARDGPGDAGPGARVRFEKIMDLARTPTHFPFEIDQEAGVEQATVHARGSSGG